ncbi:YqhA family protein [Roseomonas sp. CCTCC AB2023176]|uniref:YqhA family protein n=1 Tax=Roseomonas sp. CCTCC AB2023176 TaxID=3342640 RepID=UPI0035E0B488
MRRSVTMGDLLNKAILASRWLLAVFYLGLAAALALYAAKFAFKIVEFGGKLLRSEDHEALLALLYLLDSALVAGLVVTVILASWDTLVNRLGGDRDGRDMSWVRKLALGNLKIKLATALVAISGINLLQLFLEIGSTPDRVLTWAVSIHGMFLLSVLALAVADRLEGKKGGED